MEIMKPLRTTTCLKSRILKLERSIHAVEFVVVPDDLTPLTGVHIAQQMDLITVYEDHFVTVPPPQKKQCGESHLKHCNS